MLTSPVTFRILRDPRVRARGAHVRSGSRLHASSAPLDLLLAEAAAPHDLSPDRGPNLSQPASPGRTRLLFGRCDPACELALSFVEVRADGYAMPSHSINCLQPIN